MVRRDSIKVGIIGLGTVGGGVIRALRRNRPLIRERCGVDIEIAAVAEVDERRVRALRIPPRLATRDFRRLIKDPNVDIVVELIGGTGAAREVVMGALRAGKHVVTANKALLAKHWRRILAAAARSRCALGFEASVMAGVPVIRTIRHGLAGNAVHTLLGILNGTSNYILTCMAREKMEFSAALDEARRRGFCEADASLDIEGYDAAQKLSILGSIALGRWLPPSAIYREGIAHVEQLDIQEAINEFGYVIRPLAVMKVRPDGVEARVHPTLVPCGHRLASVEYESNALLAMTDTAGPITLVGNGAGERPAASGVLSDIIDIACALKKTGSADALVPAPPVSDRLRVVPMEDVASKFYLRFSVVDRPGVLSFISGVLGRRGVSIATCRQRGRAERGSVPVIMITHEAREGAVGAALKEINSARRIVKRRTVAIRIEE